MTAIHSDAARAPMWNIAGGRPRTFSRGVTLLLYATAASFALATIYDQELAALIAAVKWVCLAMLCLSTAHALMQAHGELPLPHPLLAFLLFALTLSIPLSIDVGLSLSTLASFAVSILTAHFIASLSDTGERRRHLFGIFANIGRLVLLSAMVCWLLGVSLGRGKDRFDAWTDNPNTLALMIAPTLVILLAGIFGRQPGWLYRCAIYIPPGIFLLQQTGSRSSIFWVAVSTFALYIFRRGASFGLILGLVVLFLFSGYGEEIKSYLFDLIRRDQPELRDISVSDIASGRSEMWQLARDLVPERPLLGHGFATSFILTDENAWVFIESQGSHFHNSYLTALVETGAVGAFALVVLISTAALRGFLSSGQLKSHDTGQALMWALIVGAAAHACFETWLLSAGNPNHLLFWSCIWMVLRREPRSSLHPQTNMS